MTEVSSGLSEREIQTRPELDHFVEGEYNRSLKSLNKTGILSVLPNSFEKGEFALGVIGIDGKEYPMPTSEQVEELFERNKELVAKKREQGFTRLQMTPLAMPISLLADRVGKAVKKHAEEGKIFQTKRNPDDPNTPVSVNADEPVYMWDRIAQGDEAEDGALVYFPQSYTDNHQGLSKEEVLQRKDICAVPGWSISLVEDAPFQPKQGEGKKLGGRKQLENNQSPKDYLAAFDKTSLLGKSPYQGETGWTPEDFLINFVTRLEETNEVSNDWNDYNAAWLTGTYLPNQGSVPSGYWYRRSERVDLDGDLPGYRFEGWGVRSSVRLSSPR